MNILTLIFTSIALAMDAFAVSLARGLKNNNNGAKEPLLLSITFGFFQAVMPLLGYLLCFRLSKSVGFLDHWVAFTLLFIIGYNMLLEKDDNEQRNIDLKLLLTLAIATSIDALAVGVSFAFLDVNIILACSIIGIITFIISLFGGIIGMKLKTNLCGYSTKIGGIVLILIGTKILVEHLFL